jgi:hypothetical protein
VGTKKCVISFFSFAFILKKILLLTFFCIFVFVNFRQSVMEEYKVLKKEKRQLQIMLHNYQEEFIKQNGRKVQYLEDRLPVQKEYDRYKVRVELGFPSPCKLSMLY